MEFTIENDRENECKIHTYEKWAVKKVKKILDKNVFMTIHSTRNFTSETDAPTFLEARLFIPREQFWLNVGKVGVTIFHSEFEEPYLSVAEKENYSLVRKCDSVIFKTHKDAPCDELGRSIIEMKGTRDVFEKEFFPEEISPNEGEVFRFRDTVILHGDIAFLENLEIREDYRGLGLGKVLLSSVLSYLKEEMIYFAIAEPFPLYEDEEQIETKIKQLQSFYSNVGFVPTTKSEFHFSPNFMMVCDLTSLENDGTY